MTSLGGMFDSFLTKFTMTLSANGPTRFSPSQRTLIETCKEKTASSMLLTHGMVSLHRLVLLAVGMVSFRAPVKQATVMDAG